MRIQKGVPIPEPFAVSIKRTKYPWPSMEAGDSFMIRVSPDKLRVRRSVVTLAGRQWCARHRPDLTVVTRTVPGGFRIWLIER